MIFFINFAVAVALIFLYRRLNISLGWFGDDHIQIPKWVVFAISILGIFIPMTPLFVDGMFLAALIYIGNEWIYQNTKWSPVMHTWKAINRLMGGSSEHVKDGKKT